MKAGCTSMADVSVCSGARQEADIAVTSPSREGGAESAFPPTHYYH